MDPMDAAVWNETDCALWQRLCDHSFERPDQGLDFTRRLAREQGWSLTQARAAIDEYRRFCFLACVNGVEVTPSAEVDEVWHLHLIHSHDYWRQFCPKVLGMDLHHGPTRGGIAEARRHGDQYAQTLALYEQWFGPPPTRWWPGTQQRFARPQQPIRVDRQRHWIVPKPDWRRALAASVTLVAASLATREALAMPANPLDWDGGSFLQLYLLLTVVAIIGAIWLRRMARDSGPARGARPGPFDLAYLAGGAERCADAAIAQMLADGTLRWDEASKRLVSIGKPVDQKPPLDAVGCCVVADGSPETVLRRATLALAPLQGALQASGLLLDDASAWRVRWYSALPLLLLVGFGATKILIGVSRGKPIGFLVLLTILLALVAVGFLLTRPTRTRAGDQALADARQHHGRALRAPRNQELGLAVALLGTAALSGTAYAAYHNVRAPASSSDSGGGSSSDGGSSDSGGGDSGGGGCGGCGGGGD